ncbi:hypothetical protein V2I01_17140 [Micromonospora sp. BRA006-A]|nr:hypothetical protein [Micromonospora sp. BRA006-A]
MLPVAFTPSTWTATLRRIARTAVAGLVIIVGLQGIAAAPAHAAAASHATVASHAVAIEHVAARQAVTTGAARSADLPAADATTAALRTTGPGTGPAVTEVLSALRRARPRRRGRRRRRPRPGGHRPSRSAARLTGHPFRYAPARPHRPHASRPARVPSRPSHDAHPPGCPGHDRLSSFVPPRGAGDADRLLLRPARHARGRRDLAGPARRGRDSGHRADRPPVPVPLGTGRPDQRRRPAEQHRSGRAGPRTGPGADPLRRRGGGGRVPCHGDRRAGRAEWLTAQEEAEAAWQAYQTAEEDVRRLTAAAALPLPRTARTPAEYADRERWLHRAAMDAQWRNEITVRQLSDILGGNGWDPSRHPVEQELPLRRLVRDNMAARHRAAMHREQAAWQAAELAAAAAQSLRDEAFAALHPVAEPQTELSIVGFAGPEATRELPTAAGVETTREPTRWPGPGGGRAWRTPWPGPDGLLPSTMTGEAYSCLSIRVPSESSVGGGYRK